MLLVSGGHTMLIEMQDHGRYRMLGQTIDDAAGEAFDKVARFLELGYPGWAGDRRRGAQRRSRLRAFPAGDERRSGESRLQLQRPQDAVVNYVRKHPDVSSADIAASFQTAVVDVLVTKTRRAPRSRVGAKGIVLGGGVAANSLLREELLGACAKDGVRGFLPSRSMCTDNAAMIAAAGWYRLASDGPSPLDTGAKPNLRLPLIDQ